VHEIACGNQGGGRGSSAKQIADRFEFENERFAARFGYGLAPQCPACIVGDGKIAAEQFAERRADFFLAGTIEQFVEPPLVVETQGHAFFPKAPATKASSLSPCADCNFNFWQKFR